MTAPPSSPPSSRSARARNTLRISLETSIGVTARVPPATEKRTTGSPACAGAKAYGVSRRVASASSGPRPMKRFTDAMVSRGCRGARRSRASAPTTTSPAPSPPPWP